MNTLNWQLKTPIDAVIFDCDGTLSTIEGIDELARYNDVSEAVKILTAEAMGKTGVNPDMYRQRLDLVKPQHKHVESLGQAYIDNAVTHGKEVISALQALGKPVFLVSAGLYPAVAFFGKALNIPSKNVFAVNLEFSDEGLYAGFDLSSPLVLREGKRQIVEVIKQNASRILYVGDGLNDLVVFDLVTRFVGYGGEFYRENIAAQCEFYIKTPSLAAVLPLTLTMEESARLSKVERNIYELGILDIQGGKVL